MARLWTMRPSTASLPQIRPIRHAGFQCVLPARPRRSRTARGTVPVMHQREQRSGLAGLARCVQDEAALVFDQRIDLVEIDARERIVSHLRSLTASAFSYSSRASFKAALTSLASVDLSPPASSTRLRGRAAACGSRRSANQASTICRRSAKKPASSGRCRPGFYGAHCCGRWRRCGFEGDGHGSRLKSTAYHKATPKPTPPLSGSSRPKLRQRVLVFRQCPTAGRATFPHSRRWRPRVPAAFRRQAKKILRPCGGASRIASVPIRRDVVALVSAAGQGGGFLTSCSHPAGDYAVASSGSQTRVHGQSSR